MTVVIVSGVAPRYHVYVILLPLGAEAVMRSGVVTLSPNWYTALTGRFSVIVTESDASTKQN